MEEERAIITAEDMESKYEDFKVIHELYSYLYDRRSEQLSDNYTRQTILIENVNDLWPEIIGLCEDFKIPLQICPKDIENLFNGFDAESIEKLCNVKRYPNIPIKKMIAVEEDLILHSIKSTFDTLLARLKKAIKKTSKRNVQQVQTPVEQPPASSPSLSDTDINILQAMNKNPQKSIIRVEIEEASGYQKFAVMNSLKRLQAAGMVCKEANKRKGWALTDKGISVAANLK